jgi:hypothetical protein
MVAYLHLGPGIDTWSSSSNFAQIFVADFNGDGKADVAGFATRSYDNSAPSPLPLPVSRLGL